MARLGKLFKASDGSSDGRAERPRFGVSDGRAARRSTPSITKPATVRIVPVVTFSTRIAAVCAASRVFKNVTTNSTPAASRLRRALRSRARTSRSQGESCKIIERSARMRPIASGVYSSRDPRILSRTSARGDSALVCAGAQSLHHATAFVCDECQPCKKGSSRGNAREWTGATFVGQRATYEVPSITRTAVGDCDSDAVGLQSSASIQILYHRRSVTLTSS